VLVGDFIWSDPRGAKAALAEADAAIRKAYAETTASGGAGHG
jgi:thiamine-phosphate pyrophosphorylase